MDKFKKNETIAVLFILICILSVSFFNFRLALRRARDSQRRSDVNSIYNALVTFREKVGVFPFADEKGRIKACKGENYESDLKKLNNAEMSVNLFLENLRGCDWGYDAFEDLVSTDKEKYMEFIPLDPRTGEEYSYKYISNGRLFQLFVYLEGEVDEEGYNALVAERNINCGVNICNFGRAFEKTPLDKSLDEYENELIQKNEK